jgi:hypothetical protein
VLKRQLPAATLGVLAVLSIAVWLAAFIRSSTSAGESPDTDAARSDRSVTASSSPSTKPSASRSPSAKPPAKRSPSAKPSATRSPSAKPSATRSPSAKPSATRSPSARPSATRSPSPRPSASANAPGAAPQREPRGVKLSATSYIGRPFETIAIRGVVPGTRTPAIVRVQQRRDGGWHRLPLPVRTDAKGRFTAYVDMGPPGTYTLRVRVPRTEKTSPVATVELS